MNIQIINVIEVINGIVQVPESFVIYEEHLSFGVVEKAEKLFTELALENGMEESYIDECLDNRSFDDNNGYEVIINWSNVNQEYDNS